PAGVQVEVDADGLKVSEISYRGAQKHGPATLWAADRTRETGQFAADLRDGRWQRFSEAGNPLDSSEYKGNKLDGQRVLFWEDGGVKVRQTYREDRPSGPFVSYFEDGQKHEAGAYDAGVKVGEWSAWNRAGLLLDSPTGDAPPAIAPTPGAGMMETAMADEDQPRFGGRQRTWWQTRLQMLQHKAKEGGSFPALFELTLARAQANGLAFDEKTGAVTEKERVP
ncbi:MAG: toxin-antitoxin system YwqK family antitoxin, partial [Myxococcaceae bacterium]